MSSPSLKVLPTYLNTSQSRLQALYSDVSRQRHSNPSSYHSHVGWWQKTLETLVSRGLQKQPHLESSEQEPNRLILRAGHGLVEELRFPGVGKPLGLGAVIAELRSTKALIPSTQFLQRTQSVYDPGWLPYRVASYILGKPLWWALEQLELVKSEESYSESEWWKRISGDYVVLGLVEQAAETVLQIRKTQGGGGGLSDDLFSFDSFRKAFGAAVNASGPLGEADTKVLIKFLERDRKVVAVDEEVIKFIDGGRAVNITAVDRGILELKIAVQSLESQIDGIQHKIDSCNEKITLALRSKHKPIALSHLRSRKQLEDLLGKRLGSLEVLRSTLIRVEGAAGDVEIMESYESSTMTLRMILDHPSLQRDKIDETMEAMANASADARELDDAIRLGGDMAVAEAGIDESELEDELQALVKESEKEREMAEIERAQGMRENAPEAPRTPPHAQDAKSRSEENHNPSIPITAT